MNEKSAEANHMDLLATVQSYLLYAIMLYFTPRSGSNYIEQDTLIQLQALAADLASKGTLCWAEAHGSRPEWEAWIVASARRRTLFAAYLFDNLVNFYLGSPSYIAKELAGLPAPGSKQLWDAPTRHSWNAAYNQQLSQWTDGQLLINDLWPRAELPSDSLKRKVDQWLSSVDEFGMMLYSVISHTYNR
ncbi:hypothetical protein PV08_03614 [Exophiala spinifera]|uniref:Xylanolytic transcriptional activator regulatory domain-containing protein n=1 Tax=Exophiala spinifera TaxID=91928 RepID=A0A0D2BL49_9EURO|nr:uncharacterized protein PV08_03614 [Exophiala spinifera]KIW19320.1 hypothetical protein PV08_03614 [Exophiala spinifera]